MKIINLNNYISKLLCLVYGIILFGPHRFLGFNYIQELLIIFLFLLYLFTQKISKKFIVYFVLINCFYIIKLIQMFSSGGFDYLIYLSIPLAFIKIGAGLFIFNENYTKIKDLIIIPTTLSFLNSFLIITQFLFPNLRFITTNHSMEISYELSNRYFGIAHDGFQITTYLSCFFLIYLIIYNKYLTKLFKLKNENFYVFLIVLLILILPSSWLFQGRFSQLISLFLLLFSFIFIKWNENSKNLELSYYLTSFRKKVIFQFTFLTSFILVILRNNLNYIINSKPIQHAFELYTKFNRFSSIGTINAIMKDKNLFDYIQNYTQWLIGKSYSGRGNFMNIPNADFDNGYFLAIFKFGVIGTLLIYTITFIPLLKLFRKSKLSILLFLIYMITNYKEQVYFSGASYLGLFIIARLEILSE